MSRVSMVEEQDHPELTELIEKLRRGRRGALINLYRLLLHSPEIVPAWFEFSNAIRWKTQLDGRLRELMIIRIARIFGVDYMFNQHVPSLTIPEGISSAECEAIANWQETAYFSERERVALGYADAMSRDVTVADRVFEQVSVHFSERQIVELTVLIGAFNMSARLMKALEIDPQQSVQVPQAVAIQQPRRQPQTGRPVIVVEDDWFTRLIGVVLDPTTSEERRAAFRDFVSHDEPDFDGYCERLRSQMPNLFPADVRLVKSIEEMRAQLPDAQALVIESFPVGAPEIQAGGKLAAVHKFAAVPRNIDIQACKERSIDVLTVRRSSSIACAEFAITLMLMLAKKAHRLAGKISPQQLAAEGYVCRPFDRRHTANSNWARIPGLRNLNGSTLGIIGVGEIGREVVLRLSAFGMQILYHQRTRLPESEERALNVNYVALDELLAESDWIVPQLPYNSATRAFLDRARFSQMKPGAFLVNISRAELVDRQALIEALESGQLGGFALDPLYESPGRQDDELLRFPNVLMTPHIAAQPRFNALNDMADLMRNLAKALAN